MVKLHTDEEIEKYIQAIKLFNKNDTTGDIIMIVYKQNRKKGI